MARSAGGDEATIVVRIDTEQARRDLAALNRAGSQAASSMSGGSPGGGGGGGSKGGARGGGGFGLADAYIGARIGRRMLSALPMAGVRAAGALSGAGAVAGALAVGPLSAIGGGAGAMIGGYFGGGADIGRAAGRGAGAASEKFFYGYSAANARGGLRALDETIASDMAMHAVGKGIIHPEQLRPIYEMRKQRAQAIEKGRLDTTDYLGHGLGRETISDSWDQSLLKRVVDAVERMADNVGRMGF